MSRPATRAYDTRVTRVERLTDHFVRITLAAEDLRHFGTAGLDQRIKLLFPFADGRMTDIGLFDESRPPLSEWYRRWRELPDADRNPMRTYTVRAVRPGSSEIDIDFVMHGTEGPASAWAGAARPGDAVIVVGPDGRSTAPGGGVEWHPGRASGVLLAGDETAAPAICAIVEQLEPHIEGLALIEVPDAADALPIRTRSRVEVRWLPRGDTVHGSALTAAVRQWGADRAQSATAGVALVEPSSDEILWEAPADAHGDHYAWLAGEAGVITSLRRHLVRDLGIDRTTVAFMGYWRHGRAEGA